MKIKLNVSVVKTINNEEVLNAQMACEGESTPEEAVELAKIAAEETANKMGITVPVVKELIEKYGDKAIALSAKAIAVKRAENAYRLRKHMGKKCLK